MCCILWGHKECGMTWWLNNNNKPPNVTFIDLNTGSVKRVAQTVKRLPVVWETGVWSLGWEDALEKEKATHSSTLAWKIPWTEETGRLQSMASQRVGHNWETSLHFTSENLIYIMLIINVSGVDQTMNNKSAYSSHVWSFWYDINWFFWSVDFQRKWCPLSWSLN